EERFADAAGGFRAPAWAPDGKRLAYAGLGGGSSLLSVRDSKGDVKRLASGSTDIAFSWSPDGAWLAFAFGSADNPGLYQGAEVIRPDGSERRQLSQDPLVAFYWSPDSRRLAILGLETATRSLAWSAVTVDGKSRRALASFVPSSDFTFQLPFFDQYAQSSSVWSADGRNLQYSAQG